MSAELSASLPEGRQASSGPVGRRAGVLLLLALGLASVIAALVLLSGGRSDQHRAVQRRTPSGLRAEGSGRSASASALGGSSPVHSATGASAAEARDPEEAHSFPVSASVHHRAAITPSVAGEQVVAAGAASDAEIRKELGKEEQAKAGERKALHDLLTPTAGGFSVGGNGTIPIPSGVPEAVQRVVAGGNAIADFPYIWGGGHASFIANGYDCSGSVSYALAAGGLLSEPLVSGDLAKWGDPGPGRWITIYANDGHTFMNVTASGSTRQAGAGRTHLVGSCRRLRWPGTRSAIPPASRGLSASPRAARQPAARLLGNPKSC